MKRWKWPGRAMAVMCLMFAVSCAAEPSTENGQSSSSAESVYVTVDGNSFHLPIGFYVTDDVTANIQNIPPSTNNQLSLDNIVKVGNVMTVYYYIDENTNGHYDLFSETARESYYLLDIIDVTETNRALSLTPKIINGSIYGDLGTHKLYMKGVGGVISSGLIYNKSLPVLNYQFRYYTSTTLDESSTVKLYLYNDTNANGYCDELESHWMPDGTEWFYEIDMGSNNQTVNLTCTNVTFY